MKWVKLFDSINKALNAVPEQSSRLVKFGDYKICLVNHQNKLYALEDRCPHMGASLSQGIVNYKGDVICPLHEYRFNVKTGDECNQKCGAARSILLEINENGVVMAV